jgi:hypothetical protein
MTACQASALGLSDHRDRAFEPRRINYDPTARRRASTTAGRDLQSVTLKSTARVTVRCTPRPKLPRVPTARRRPAAANITETHQPYPLATGTATLQAADGNFCGYCRDIDTLCFDGDPDRDNGNGQKLCPDSAVIPNCEPFSYHHGGGGDISGCGPLAMLPCKSNDDCYAPYGICQQRQIGAFDYSAGRTISMVGSPAGNISDRAQHDATLSGLFCAPASFSQADEQASIPGPGAVSFPAKLQLRP